MWLSVFCVQCVRVCVSLVCVNYTLYIPYIYVGYAHFNLVEFITDFVYNLIIISHFVVVSYCNILYFCH